MLCAFSLSSTMRRHTLLRALSYLALLFLCTCRALMLSSFHPHSLLVRPLNFIHWENDRFIDGPPFIAALVCHLCGQRLGCRDSRAGFHRDALFL